MKNNFKENLHQKIIDDISINATSDLQNQLSNEAAQCCTNIYDTINSLSEDHFKLSPSRKRNNVQKNQIDYTLALNLFMQKFYMENKNEIDNMRIQHIEKQKTELKITATANPNYFLAKDGCYYLFDYDKYIKQPQIINISENGQYTTKEKIHSTNYYAIKTYSQNDSIIQISVVDNYDKKLIYLSEIIKILDLKKEMVKKVKRIGYCGKSIDTLADLMNIFCRPVETGYYSDNRYNFYKWDFRNHCLMRQIRDGNTPGAPNIADYEQRDSKTIIRTDYTGSGLCLQLS